MTRAEKLREEHPEIKTDIGCPADYGYESQEEREAFCEMRQSCEECWNRLFSEGE